MPWWSTDYVGVLRTGAHRREDRGRAMEYRQSRSDWHDFKPTFAAEQLAKRHLDPGQQGDGPPVG